MEFSLDEGKIAVAINDAATKALMTTLGGYDMQTAIAQIVSDEVARGAIADSIRLAVKQVDRSALAGALAAELQRATTRAAVTILNEGLVDIVCKLRGIGQYGDDVKRRAEVKAELINNLVK